MNLVDSSGWIEYFMNSPLAGRYEKHLQPPQQNWVPAIVLYEVYKKIKQEKGEAAALVAVSVMQQSPVMALDEDLALEAADISLRYRLAMADAMVYASAIRQKANLITSDKDMKDLPQVIYYPKS